MLSLSFYRMIQKAYVCKERVSSRKWGILRELVTDSILNNLTSTFVTSFTHKFFCNLPIKCCWVQISLYYVNSNCFHVMKAFHPAVIRSLTDNSCIRRNLSKCEDKNSNNKKKKSRIRETKHLSTDADSGTD